MDTWTIDIASPKDASALADLAGVTFPLACPPEATKDEITAHIATHLTEVHFGEWLRDPHSIVVVARARDQLVGYALICMQPEEETPQIAALLSVGPTCELSKCYVHPSFQGTGLAAELVRAALHQATTRQVRGAWLGVNASNAKAIAFYHKCGFRIIGPRRYNVGGRIHDDHIMEICLSPDSN